MADMRNLRGKAIASKGNQIRKVNDYFFKVRSQSCNGFYDVRSTMKGMTCTCKDFARYGGKCKHIIATRYYLGIERNTTTVIEQFRRTYKQAWKAYTEAQKAEINLFEELLRD